MKRKVFVVVLLVFALALISFASAPFALAGDPNTVMQAMFAQHPDFPCVGAFQVQAHKMVRVKDVSEARVPELDAFALEKNLDPDAVQCFGWVWHFDRDVNAINPFFGAGSGSPKGHYAKRGLTIYDLNALRDSDINEIVYELGGQPAYPFLNDGGYPISSRWERYPTRFLMYDQIPY